MNRQVCPICGAELYHLVKYEGLERKGISERGILELGTPEIYSDSKEWWQCENGHRFADERFDCDRMGWVFDREGSKC